MEMGIIIDQCRKERPWDKAKSIFQNPDPNAWMQTEEKKWDEHAPFSRGRL
jgi:hypothetical protein